MFIARALNTTHTLATGTCELVFHVPTDTNAGEDTEIDADKPWEDDWIYCPFSSNYKDFEVYVIFLLGRATKPR